MYGEAAAPDLNGRMVHVTILWFLPSTTSVSFELEAEARATYWSLLDSAQVATAM